eukprot:GHVR01126952.1.p1 GENE.GHVR01126952.1~~GHVR01126952.1.p1  ORF type:complete len:519 (+),score=54.56 GHVR01126952.1:112-1668(+)
MFNYKEMIKDREVGINEEYECSVDMFPEEVRENAMCAWDRNASYVSLAQRKSFCTSDTQLKLNIVEYIVESRCSKPSLVSSELLKFVFTREQVVSFVSRLCYREKKRFKDATGFSCKPVIVYQKLSLLCLLNIHDIISIMSALRKSSEISHRCQCSISVQNYKLCAEHSCVVCGGLTTVLELVGNIPKDIASFCFDNKILLNKGKAMIVTDSGQTFCEILNFEDIYACIRRCMDGNYAVQSASEDLIESVPVEEVKCVISVTEANTPVVHMVPGTVNVIKNFDEHMVKYDLYKLSDEAVKELVSNFDFFKKSFKKNELMISSPQAIRDIHLDTINNLIVERAVKGERGVLFFFKNYVYFIDRLFQVMRVTSYEVECSLLLDVVYCGNNFVVNDLITSDHYIRRSDVLDKLIESVRGRLDLLRLVNLDSAKLREYGEYPFCTEIVVIKDRDKGYCATGAACHVMMYQAGVIKVFAEALSSGKGDIVVGWLGKKNILMLLNVMFLLLKEIFWNFMLCRGM